MYGVDGKMTPPAAAQTMERDASKDSSLSPELREVMHMLEAIEQTAKSAK